MAPQSSPHDIFDHTGCHSSAQLFNNSKKLHLIITTVQLHDREQQFEKINDRTTTATDQHALIQIAFQAHINPLPQAHNRDSRHGFVSKAMCEQRTLASRRENFHGDRCLDAWGKDWATTGVTKRMDSPIAPITRLELRQRRASST